MSRPQSDKPDGTTHHAQVDNTGIPAGERPNRTPIFISSFGDDRSFLAWLRAFCSGGLMANLKGEKLMVSHHLPTGSESRPAHCSPLI